MDRCARVPRLWCARKRSMCSSSQVVKPPLFSFSFQRTNGSGFALGLAYFGFLALRCQLIGCHKIRTPRQAGQRSARIAGAAIVPAHLAVSVFKALTVFGRSSELFHTVFHSFSSEPQASNESPSPGKVSIAASRARTSQSTRLSYGQRHPEPLVCSVPILAWLAIWRCFW